METKSESPIFASMFTGIIETMGRVEAVTPSGTNTIFWISSTLTPQLKPDQSVSHNGVCLTVEETANDRFRVTAIAETLEKSNLGHWRSGDLVNLERCMVMNGRLDGHIVQGHVDTIATCTARTNLEGSVEFRFRFPEAFASLVVEKGSISVNGISLTIFDVTRTEFTVAIVPYTLEHTNIGHISVGSTVNIEFDLIGKYVNRIAQLRNS